MGAKLNRNIKKMRLIFGELGIKNSIFIPLSKKSVQWHKSCKNAVIYQRAKCWPSHLIWIKYKKNSKPICNLYLFLFICKMNANQLYFHLVCEDSSIWVLTIWFIRIYDQIEKKAHFQINEWLFHHKHPKRDDMKIIEWTHIVTWSFLRIKCVFNQYNLWNTKGKFRVPVKHYNQFISKSMIQQCTCFISSSPNHTQHWKCPTQSKTTSILNMNQMSFTLNRSGPIGGLAYGTPKNAFIDRPPCDRSVLPTNLLPFGNVTRNSSDVLALINAMKLFKIETNTRTTSCLFILALVKSVWIQNPILNITNVITRTKNPSTLNKIYWRNSSAVILIEDWCAKCLAFRFRWAVALGFEWWGKHLSFKYIWMRGKKRSVLLSSTHQNSFQESDS